MPAPDRELAEKLRKKRINEKIAKNRLKGGIESREDIKARVKGIPKPKPKGSNMKSYDPMGAGLRTIKVRKGDNLTHIADRIGTTVAILKKLNPNVKPRYMDIGMKLLVPSGRKG